MAARYSVHPVCIRTGMILRTPHSALHTEYSVLRTAPPYPVCPGTGLLLTNLEASEPKGTASWDPIIGDKGRKTEYGGLHTIHDRLCHNLSIHVSILHTPYHLEVYVEVGIEPSSRFSPPWLRNTSHSWPQWTTQYGWENGAIVTNVTVPVMIGPD